MKNCMVRALALSLLMPALLQAAGETKEPVCVDSAYGRPAMELILGGIAGFTQAEVGRRFDTLIGANETEQALPNLADDKAADAAKEAAKKARDAAIAANAPIKGRNDLRGWSGWFSPVFGGIIGDYAGGKIADQANASMFTNKDQTDADVTWRAVGQQGAYMLRRYTTDGKWAAVAVNPFQLMRFASALKAGAQWAQSQVAAPANDASTDTAAGA